MLEPEQIVKERMLANDPFSLWLGIQVIEVSLGKVVLEMVVREEMCNGFGIAHGGIAYSLADSALAFASNAHGIQSLSIDTSINHLKPVHSGDILTAVTREQNVSNKTGLYIIHIFKGEEMVALFKGLVYRTGKHWV